MSEFTVPAALRDLASLRTILKGEPVFRVDTPARHVYFLLRGRVALNRFGPLGEEVAIHVAGARLVRPERVRHLLLTEGRGKLPIYTLRGTVRELAGQLGLTHESLYRTLAAMTRDGSIERAGNDIKLCH